MGMVATPQRIASAYFVVFGNYGDVRRYAEERGVCRQWIYREAIRTSKNIQMIGKLTPLAWPTAANCACFSSSKTTDNARRTDASNP